MPIALPSYWLSPVAEVAPATPRRHTAAKTTFSIAAAESPTWPAAHPLVASPMSFSKTARPRSSSRPGPSPRGLIGSPPRPT
eukprot:6887406-Pyramimonas_sp.AAC.1